MAKAAVLFAFVETSEFWVVVDGRDSVAETWRRWSVYGEQFE